MLDHIAAVLNPGGVVFGSTILSGVVKRGVLARRISRFYYARGIFSNLNDSLADLKDVLARRFSDVTIHPIGCVALFVGRKSGSRVHST